MIWVTPSKPDTAIDTLGKRLKDAAEARFDFLLNRPKAGNIGVRVNAARRDIEKHNPFASCRT